MAHAKYLATDMEVMYDLTWCLAHKEQSGRELFPDSRERFNVLMAWAECFHNKHLHTNWATEDYLTLIDEYADERIAELV